ncbi:DUF2946 family protein [soil metagenome]
MDESVVQALAKWPNVPHCHGWLALDRRGRWRMRDEFAQAHGLLGDVIRHDALRAFIERNYLSDEHGAWFFQNGPQRVYVELDATPFVMFADDQGWHTQTGLRVDHPLACLVDADGHVYLEGPAGIGLVCDRDLQAFIDRLDGSAEQLIDAPDHLHLNWRDGQGATPLQRVDASTLPARYGFVAHPAAALTA